MTKFDLQHDEIMQNLGKIPTKLLTKAIPRIAFEQVERSKTSGSSNTYDKNFLYARGKIVLSCYTFLVILNCWVNKKKTYQSRI